MKILALDSTAKAAAVALLCDGKLISKDMHDDGNTHSSTLLPMIEKILKAGHLAPTGCNFQPQRILVLNNDESITNLKTLLFQTQLLCDPKHTALRCNKHRT